MTSRRRAPQERAVQRHRAILSAARDLVVTAGMGEVTHRRVADAAHVPSAAVRYYFSSRETLLLACLDDLAADRAHEAQQLRAGASPDLSGEEVGRRVVRTIWGPDDSDTALIGAVGAALDGVRESPALSARMRELRQTMDDDVRGLLERSGRRVRDLGLVTAVVNGSIVDSAAEGHPDVARRAALAVAALLESAPESAP